MDVTDDPEAGKVEMMTITIQLRLPAQELNEVTNGQPVLDYLSRALAGFLEPPNCTRRSLSVYTHRTLEPEDDYNREAAD